jgi:uncharacterized protein (TIGR00369 family)
VDPTAPNADRFAPLTEYAAAMWLRFFDRIEGEFFPRHVGLEVEEVRTDYCRMRLPYRPLLNQPAGVVHGGAIATLIDTVVVPAIAMAYVTFPRLLTLHMGVNYVGAVIGVDAVAEGFVIRRGRSAAFCQVEVRTPDGNLAATGDLVYSLRTS